MMNDAMTAEITAPYAQALMSVAQDANAADQVGQEVSDLLEVLDSSEELSTFLESADDRRAEERASCGRSPRVKFSPFLLKLSAAAGGPGSGDLLPEILKQYQALMRELNQTVLANVTLRLSCLMTRKTLSASRVSYDRGQKR
jgi:F-type H+-transporting ATPase subunit delta